MATEDVEIIGMKELDTALKQFSLEVRGNILRPAMAAGARMFQQAILSRAKQTFKPQSGDLFRNIDVQPVVRPSGADTYLGFKIGIRKTKNKPYPRWWEKGFDHIGRGRSKANLLRRGKKKLVLADSEIEKFLRSRTFQTLARKPGTTVESARLTVKLRGLNELARTGRKHLRREFMLPAFDAVYSRVLEMVVQKIRDGIERAAAAVYRRAA